LEAWLAGLRLDCSNRILPVTEEIALQWGRLTARTPRGDADSLIAATAIVHGLTVVTRNVTDFADTGAAVVNPWES
jgi:toxin FitB